MIRVLHCVNNMHRAGLETMIMNYYRNIDRNQIQFDFLVHRSERSDYDDEIESLGGRIFRAPRLYPQNYPAYFSYMKKFFRDHPEYRIVHSHIDAMSFLPLLAAKRAGVPVRIAHSHNTSIDLDFKYPLKQIFRFCLNSVSTHRFACGEKAGEFLFRGRESKVLANAIDKDQFLFNNELRQKKRAELCLGEKLVIGHVGRFSMQKNHKFLMEIFAAVLRCEPEAILILAGTGEKEAEIKRLANELNISSNVLFLGSRSDMVEIYQAMDVFVLPSLFEGVPVVGIEAQFSGLPCLFSDKVPEEVAFTDTCTFLPIEVGAEVWARHILKLSNMLRSRNVNCSKYDIKIASNILEEHYLSM